MEYSESKNKMGLYTKRKKEIDNRFKNYRRHLDRIGSLPSDKIKSSILNSLIGHIFNEVHRTVLLIELLEFKEDSTTKSIAEIQNKLDRVMKKLDIK